MSESRKLLKEFVNNRSESAFRELVERYLNLVHSVALRLAGGDTHLAEDVTQIVFADLAAMAPKLPERVLLGGWLHQHTCFVTNRTLRTERRRRIRERQAAEMNSKQDHTEANLARIAPLLDEAIGRLGTSDRTAIILRYFEQYDLRSIGEALGTTEDAAQKRVSRALEKLHVLLKRRGATLSAAALGTALATEAVTSAPAGLAGAATAAAFSGTTATTTAATAATKAIAMTTLQKAIAGAVLILLLWAIASVIFEWPLFYAGRPLYPCFDALGHIEASKRGWALETGQTNGTPVDPVQLERFVRTKGGLSPKYPMPHCQSGGIYTYGNVGQLPTCSLATKASPTPVRERVGLFGWRWKIAPSQPESHVLTSEWIQHHLASPEEMQQLAH